MPKYVERNSGHMESVSKRTMSNQNTGNTVQQMESEFTPGVEIKIIVAVIFLMAVWS